MSSMSSSTAITTTPEDLVEGWGPVGARRPRIAKQPFSRIDHVPVGEEAEVIALRMAASSQRRRLALLREQASQV